MVTNAFRPNRSLTGQAWTILLIVEAVLFLLAWTFGDAYSIPGPYDVLQALGKAIREDGLLYELGVSFRINAEALAISTVISVGLAWLSVLPSVRPIVAVLSRARFLSLAGFVTVFTFAFGGGHALKVSLLTFGISVFFLTSMASVIASIPRADWDQARSLRMSEWRSVWEIAVLGKADETFEMFRQNAAIGWVMLTMVEGLVRSEGGVGGILLNSTRYRNFAAVFAVQIAVALLGAGQDRLIAYIKDKVCPHSALTLERN
jgi:NitT/TauT family transport system permease protein